MKKKKWPPRSASTMLTFTQTHTNWQKEDGRKEQSVPFGRVTFSPSATSQASQCVCVCVWDCVQVGQWDAFLLICVSVYIWLDNLDYPWMHMCIFSCTWTLEQEDGKEAVILWNHAWQYMWSHVWGVRALCAELRWHFQPACLWLEATGDRAATSLPGRPGPH